MMRRRMPRRDGMPLACRPWAQHFADAVQHLQLFGTRFGIFYPLVRQKLFKERQKPLAVRTVLDRAGPAAQRVSPAHQLRSGEDT